MGSDARIVLSDTQPEVLDAWRRQFAEKHPDVEIREGDIFAAGTDAVVVPGNAFGYLDRGLELSLCEHFGWEVQDALRQMIRDEFFGELLVGQACAIPLSGGSPDAPRTVIYSCQYRTPGPLDESLAAYLAARGALRLVRDDRVPGVSSVAIPGLGTRAGLNPHASARQLRYAFQIFRGLKGFGDKNISQLTRRERKLRQIPRSVLTEDGEPAEDSSP